MGQYLGLVQLGTSLTSSHITRTLATSSTPNVPKFADSPPTFRIYGPQGLLQNATGSLTNLDPSATGATITNATNAAPIVITAAAHGFSTGMRVTISGVLGNTAANGDFQIIVNDANTFTLQGPASVGNGNYTSGGVAFATGVYKINYIPQSANGFASGTNYAMLISWQMGGVAQGDIHTFTVV